MYLKFRLFYTLNYFLVLTYLLNDCHFTCVSKYFIFGGTLQVLYSRVFYYHVIENQD